MKIIMAFFSVLLALLSVNVAAESQLVISDHKTGLMGGDFSLAKKWEVSGFSMPESVFASANHPWLYVSNVNGSALGFISRVAKDGTVDNLRWAVGLSSPTGSDVHDNILYVADEKALRLISLSTGKVVKSVVADSAVSLNDVAIDQRTGIVYVSDVPGGKIYCFKDGKLSVWFESPKIPFPNGVLVKEDKLVVANYAIKNGEGLMRKEWKPEGFGSLFTIDLKTQKLETITASVQKGVYDGVIEFNGFLMASSNPTGQVLSFDQGRSYLLESTEKGIADINTDASTIYAPYLFDNTLVAFSPEAWDRITTKQEYLEKAAGQFFGEAGGMSVATVDGKIMGSFAGQMLKGEWSWKDTYFCRTSTLGKMDLGYDCIMIEVTPTKMRLTLNKGQGMQVVYNKIDEDAIQDLYGVNVFTHFKVKPDQINQYIQGMNENVDIVRKEPGNTQMRFFQGRSNATDMFLIGRNEDKEQLAVHTQAVEKRGIAEKLAPTVAAAPVVRFLSPIHSLNGHYTKYNDPEKTPYVVFSLVTVKSQFEREYLTEMKRQVALSRAEADNLLFDFYRVNNGEHTYFVHGEWQDKKAFDVHVMQEHTQSVGALFDKVLVGGKSKNKLYQVNELNSHKKE